MIARLIFVLGCLAFFADASAKAIDATISGSWYNPDQSGHGLSIEYLDENTTIIYWYTYTPDRDPTFLVIGARNQGARASGTATIQDGMQFGQFNPNDVSRTEWGTVSITYNSCTSLTLSYNSNQPGYGSGTINMEKLVSIEGVKCTNNAVHGNYTVVNVDRVQQEFGFGAAFLFENGYSVWFGVDGTEGGVGIGTWRQGSGDNITLSGTSYGVSGGASTINGSGRTYANGLDLNYANGQIFATRQVTFQTAVRTSDIQGSYDIRDGVNGGIIGTISISSTGLASGRTFDGCDLNGAIYSPDGKFNQLVADMEISGCVAPTAFFGAGVFSKAQGSALIAVTDGFAGYVYELLP